MCNGTPSHWNFNTGCNSLEILNCAENHLENLTISDKPNLETVSCKETSLRNLKIEICPNLEFLDFSRQHISPFVDHYSTKLEIRNSEGLSWQRCYCSWLKNFS